jgi:hypothetical protein
MTQRNCFSQGVFQKMGILGNFSTALLQYLYKQKHSLEKCILLPRAPGCTFPSPPQCISYVVYNLQDLQFVVVVAWLCPGSMNWAVASGCDDVPHLNSPHTDIVEVPRIAR